MGQGFEALLRGLETLASGNYFVPVVMMLGTVAIMLAIWFRKPPV